MAFPELHFVAKQFSKEMGQVDEVAHVLLKAHLILEESLVRILEQYVFHREHLSECKLTFNQKLLLARSLCLRKNQLGEWELLAAINSLRNELAHRLQSATREKKIERVKEIYFREATGLPELAAIKQRANADILFAACGHCAGFLANFEADSVAFRSMIHGIDREINPTLAAFQL